MKPMLKTPPQKPPTPPIIAWKHIYIFCHAWKLQDIFLTLKDLVYLRLFYPLAG